MKNNPRNNLHRRVLTIDVTCGAEKDRPKGRNQNKQGTTVPRTPPLRGTETLRS